MIYLSLDRTEDGNIAVLVDDNGKKFDVPLSELGSEATPGSVYRLENNSYIYDKEETEIRRKRLSEKKMRLLKKAVNGDNGKG